MARSKPFLISLGLTLLFVAMAVIFARPSARRDPIRDHSATRTNPWGTKALWELCRAHGLKTAYWQSSLSSLSQKQQYLCLFDPTFALSDEDLQKLVDWVQQGGSLLLAVDLDASHDLTFDRPKIAPNEALLAPFGLTGTRTGAAATITVPAASRAIRELRDVRSIYIPSPHRLQPASKAAALARLQWRTLLADGAGAVLLSARHGRGHIYAVSETEILSNSSLARADNVVLAANLLFDGRATTVHFDEAIHAVKRGLSDEARQLDPSRALTALLAVIAALTLYLVSRGWRFGAPTPVNDAPRRSALEFVNAFAELYRRAGARGATVDLLRHSFRLRLATAAGVPADLPPAAVAAAVAGRHQVSEASLTALLQQLEPRSAGEPLTDSELLALTRQMAHLEEALDHVRKHR